MKTSETRSAAAASKSSTPFFSKDSSQNFFGASAKEKSFFTQDKNSPGIQAKLSIGQPNDKYEREADSVADKVVQRLAQNDTQIKPNTYAPINNNKVSIQQKQVLPAASITPLVQLKCNGCDQGDKLQKQEKADDAGIAGELLQKKPIFESNAEPPEDGNSVQRKCAGCEQEENLQKKTDAGTQTSSAGIESSLTATKGSGDSLPAATREQMEGSFGVDFSNVRIHTGGAAAQMNESLNAHAFTNGNDIYFNAGKYDTKSKGGQHLLAHELTHTVQQGGIKYKNQEGNYSGSKKNQIQRFNIPGTDYETDFSIEGVKNAGNIAVGAVKDGASWVKNKAEQGFDWIVDKVKSLVSAGYEFLTSQWNSLKQFATNGLNKVTSFFNKIAQVLAAPFNAVFSSLTNLDGAALSGAWNGFTGFVNNIWQFYKKQVSVTVTGIFDFFESIGGKITGIFSNINRFANRLPDSLRYLITKITEPINSLWKTVQSNWQSLKKTIADKVTSILNATEIFVKRILSFAINKIVEGLLNFGQLLLTIFDFFKNPDKYLNPLSKRISGYLDGVEGKFLGQIGKYFGNIIKPQSKAASSKKTTIMRQVASPSTESSRSTSSWSEIGSGIWDVMKQKWQEFKKDPLSIVKGLLLDLFVPVIGNVKDIISLFKDIKKIVTKPLKASSLEEFWTSFLKIADIPILILHTIVSILGRSLMLPLLIASFIPHPLVKAIATAVGYALLGGFVGTEILNVEHKVILLKTGLNDGEEKKDAYNRIADSFIALAMAALIAILVWIIAIIAQIIKGVYNFIKGKIFSPKEIVVEPAKTGEVADGNPPKEGENPPPKGQEKPRAERDLGENKKMQIDEQGKCKICASPCDFINEKYTTEIESLPPEKIIEIKAKIKAIEENTKLSDAQKMDALEPIEKELASIKEEGIKNGNNIAKTKGLPEPPEGHHWVKKSDGSLSLQRNPGFDGPLLEYDAKAPKIEGVPEGFKEAEGSRLSAREQTLPKPLQDRAKLKDATKAEVLRNADTKIDAAGERRWADGKTGELIPGDKTTPHPDTGKPVKGDFHFGHETGDIAWKDYQELHRGDVPPITRDQVIADQNHPAEYRVEGARSNSQAGAKANAQAIKEK